MSIERFYVNCSKLVPTETINSRSVPIKTYSESSINGYIGSGSDNIIRVADKDTIESRYNFYCNDFNINTGDLIKYEGDTYEVTSIPKNTAHRNNHIKAQLRKIDNIKQE